MTMKTMGMIGGMSWESTASYYQMINRGVKQRLGGLHSAKLVLVSVDFAEIEQMQHAGDWDGTAGVLSDAAQAARSAGADALMICTNTMHKVAGQVQAATELPLLHIADCTAEVLREQRVSTVGLLGTAFTMEQTFYSERLEQQQIKVLTPNAEDRDLVHRVIYDELCLGQINDTSRAHFLRIIDDLAAAGAEAVILGCTEIGLLVGHDDTHVALYDTTAIHAEAAVKYMLDID